MAARRAALRVVLCAAVALCAAGIGASPTAAAGGAGCRKHVRRVTDYGAVGDGRTLNTAAFARAVSDLASCAGDGGAALVVPAGRWLTGPFNLTSHFTLFLHRGAEILASQDLDDWPLIAPLPSYGRGRDEPGPRYSNFIGGSNLTDVIISGNKRNHQRAGAGVVGQVPRQGAHPHARLPARAPLLPRHHHLQRHLRRRALLEPPPHLLHQCDHQRRHDSRAGQLAKHRRNRPRFFVSCQDRGLLHRVRRRLRRREERLGRVRHPVQHAQPAHRRQEAHLHLPDKRHDRARQRDVRRHPGRARGGQRRHQHRVGRQDQVRRGEGRLRQGRLRAPPQPPHHEVGLLDDRQLRPAPRQLVRPQGAARGHRHQLPRRVRRERDHGRQDGGHPQRPLHRDMHVQRHHAARTQGQEAAMELHSCPRSGIRRLAGAVPGAWGRGQALHIPRGRARHRSAWTAQMYLLI